MRNRKREQFRTRLLGALQEFTADLEQGQEDAMLARVSPGRVAVEGSTGHFSMEASLAVVLLGEAPADLLSTVTVNQATWDQIVPLATRLEEAELDAGIEAGWCPEDVVEVVLEAAARRLLQEGARPLATYLAARRAAAEAAQAPDDGDAYDLGITEDAWSALSLVAVALNEHLGTRDFAPDGWDVPRLALAFLTDQAFVDDVVDAEASKYQQQQAAVVS